MPSVEVKAQNQAYMIYIERDLLKTIHTKLTAFAGKKAMVITDTTVAKHYLKEVVQQFEKAGVAVDSMVIESGETSKCNDVLQSIYEQLFQANITRSDIIVALGGGVIGDLVGYAAATFLRGVPFIQVPTTLLAQVDSSVGGKVAINVPQGKNLVGTFYQPAMVLTDLDVLNTLDARQRLAGLAEVYKYGCIAEATIIDELLSTEDTMDRVIAQCCQIKANYVAKDPYDHGIRAQLNFGHTLAHAIEKLCGYGTYLHGEAVSIGMPAAARWGELLGVTPLGTADTLREQEEKLGMTTLLPDMDMQETIDTMMGDKKAMGKQLNLVLLESIGKAIVQTVTKEELTQIVKESWEWLKS